jgi:hypothetical protein
MPFLIVTDEKGLATLAAVCPAGEDAVSLEEGTPA